MSVLWLKKVSVNREYRNGRRGGMHYMLKQALDLESNSAM
jgi:hypothetical protein